MQKCHKRHTNGFFKGAWKIMNRTMENGIFLILSKNEINDMLANEKEYIYKIIQIEPGFDGDYMVEVVEKGLDF